MISVCSALRRGLRAQVQVQTPVLVRRISSNHQVFAEGDIVLLRRLKDNVTTLLTTALKPTKKVDTHHGTIAHTAIIGQTTRSLITSSSGTQYCATFPSIEEYVTKVRRLVTPVYPLDAATIVALLDIHVTAGCTPPVEIFEAGTGHGSLTLQLCRAIHAANPPSCSSSARGAILHSIDNSARHSQRAAEVVHGFRRGLYSPHVDFHVSTPTAWVRSELERRGSPFLTHALLDMPSPHDHLSALADALLPDGVLGVFCPSVTQIGECLKAVRGAGLPLGKNMVVEFPPHSELVGAGLRTWNVKYAVVRARAREVEVQEEGESEGEAVGAGAGAGEEDAEPEQGSREVLVCRPSVGERLVGGGFFGIFRKKGEC